MPKDDAECGRFVPCVQATIRRFAVVSWLSIAVVARDDPRRFPELANAFAMFPGAASRHCVSRRCKVLFDFVAGWQQHARTMPLGRTPLASRCLVSRLCLESLGPGWLRPQHYCLQGCNCGAYGPAHACHPHPRSGSRGRVRRALRPHHSATLRQPWCCGRGRGHSSCACGPTAPMVGVCRGSRLLSSQPPMGVARCCCAQVRALVARKARARALSGGTSLSMVSFHHCRATARRLESGARGVELCPIPNSERPTPSTCLFVPFARLRVHYL